MALFICSHCGAEAEIDSEDCAEPCDECGEMMDNQEEYDD